MVVSRQSIKMSTGAHVIFISPMFIAFLRDFEPATTIFVNPVDQFLQKGLKIVHFATIHIDASTLDKISFLDKMNGMASQSWFSNTSPARQSDETLVRIITKKVVDKLLTNFLVPNELTDRWR